MVYVCKFPFGGTQLNLKTLEPIHDSDAERISSFIKEFQQELNHNLINSSAYRFNEAQVNFPVLSKPSFINFLKLNILLSRSLENSFNSFVGLDKDDDIQEVIVIDEKEELVTKTKDIALGASLIKNDYILDVLINFIAKELGIDAFLIETPTVYMAIGPEEWLIKIPAIEDRLGLRNEALLIEEYSNADSKNQFKFGSFEEPIEAEKLILIGNSAVTNKLRYMEFPKLKYVNDFHKHASINKIHFAVIDSKGEAHMFIGS